MQSMYAKQYNQAETSFLALTAEDRSMILDYLKLLINRQVSPNTLRGVINGLKSFYGYLQSTKIISLNRVTKEQVRDYLDYLTKRSLSVSTIYGYLAILKAFFEHLADEDYLDKVPVLRRYFPQKAFRLPRPMSDEDVQVFLSNLKDLQYGLIFLLMLRSGLRIGEVCQLQTSDIHFEERQLMIRNGKGKVDRIVYFSLAVEQRLRRWLAKRPTASSYCFAAHQDPACPMPAITIRKWMEQYLKRLGLEQKGYTPHSLRHTFATSLLNAGIPLEALRDLLGHRSLNQTLMYAKLSPQTIAQSYHQACQRLERDLALANKEVFHG